MPQLYDLAGNPMSWAEAKARAEAWYARQRVREPVKPFKVPREVRAEPAQLLIQALEKMAGIPAGTIRSDRRDEETVELRDAVILVLRMRGWQLERIASAVNRTHSGVSLALTRARRRHDREFRSLVEVLQRV